VIIYSGGTSIDDPADVFANIPPSDRLSHSSSLGIGGPVFGAALVKEVRL
jgi:hypothetical protein